MRKSDLDKEISVKTGIEKVFVETTLAAFMDAIKQHVANDERVSLRGFGIFYARKRAAKVARNINKNTAIHLPAQYVPMFRPVPKFKQKVRTGVK